MSLCMSTLNAAPLISTSPTLITSSSIKLAVSPQVDDCTTKVCCIRQITPFPGVPLPSGSPSGSMESWVLCIVLTFVLPFITHKWGPLIALKNRVDTAVDMAEHIAEVIEDVAGKVDKVIDNITDDLPEDSKLRKRLEAVDELIEGVAMSAHIANDIIDKVEEAEDKLESLILSHANEEKDIGWWIRESLGGDDDVSCSAKLREIESLCLCAGVDLSEKRKEFLDAHRRKMRESVGGDDDVSCSTKLREIESLCVCAGVDLSEKRKEFLDAHRRKMRSVR
ncbi:unnamed protein product [Lactuca saligna]|uniref:Uncharacterized protein n=1 Tax=Lactuca saligna TaxID=75948 RepID=A0AA36EP14_LACSI|nr:unnamed protein product [Lactuca saligna]